MTIDYTSKDYWAKIAQYALLHADNAAPISDFVQVRHSDGTVSSFSRSTATNDIQSQMEDIYGEEYPETLVYNARDSYQSKVYEEMEYHIGLSEKFEIKDRLSTVSFVTTVLGVIPGNLYYNVTMGAISIIAGGLSYFTDTSILEYTATAYYVQYGYCMREPWVSYEKECVHKAYAQEDNNGVVDGQYALVEEPFGINAAYEFDDFETIVENAIEMYQYWG